MGEFTSDIAHCLGKNIHQAFRTVARGSSSDGGSGNSRGSSGSIYSNSFRIGRRSSHSSVVVVSTAAATAVFV
jgi:hypothetical protein